jgi:hypothetical protein
MPDRVTGQALCAICGWQAQVTADDLDELRVSVHKLVVKHVELFHPDQAGNGVVIDVEDRKRDAEPSHYVDWDVPGKRLVRALCGDLISRRDHTNDPTCDTCRRVLADRAKQVGP